MDALKKLAPYVHWGLRLTLAATFIYHGWSKIPVEGPMGSLSVPVVWSVAIAELVAGICLIVGAFTKDVLTRLGGAIVIVIMIGAIAIVHWKNGFSVLNGGMEFQLLMLATGLYFLGKGNDA